MTLLIYFYHVSYIHCRYFNSSITLNTSQFYLSKACTVALLNVCSYIFAQLPTETMSYSLHIAMCKALEWHFENGLIVEIIFFQADCCSSLFFITLKLNFFAICTKQKIGRRHIGLEEIAMGIFHHFQIFYRLND